MGFFSLLYLRAVAIYLCVSFMGLHRSSRLHDLGGASPFSLLPSFFQYISLSVICFEVYGGEGVTLVCLFRKLGVWYVWYVYNVEEFIYGDELLLFIHGDLLISYLISDNFPYNRCGFEVHYKHIGQLSFQGY